MQIPLRRTDRSSVGGSDDGLSSFDSDGFSIGDWNNINQARLIMFGTGKWGLRLVMMHLQQVLVL